jgi:hypothetical protein
MGSLCAGQQIISEALDTSIAQACAPPSCNPFLPSLPFPPLPSLQENELLVGRVAQLGFAASLIGEILTGKGPLEQLGLEIGIPLYEVEGALAAWILFLFFAAINPGSGKFINADDA